MLISQLHHITTAKSGQEFVIHFQDEYDYRFKSQYCDQAVKTLQSAYLNLTGTQLSAVELSDVDGLAAQVSERARSNAARTAGGGAAACACARARCHVDRRCARTRSHHRSRGRSHRGSHHRSRPHR